ncbi:hypothetical protein AUG19_04445 [archaeon 13_1_20CM_2_54_9]|nr:MAG: hypothetical protein AUJ07_09125 [Crenarchaeota archaeon 13_1_40CM_3_53_5]OLE75784.1 MAG: hypothetical protein AUG19_04445 [archaeon 13_1_20CM_2_54_9]
MVPKSSHGFPIISNQAPSIASVSTKLTMVKSAPGQTVFVSITRTLQSHMPKSPCAILATATLLSLLLFQTLVLPSQGVSLPTSCTSLANFTISMSEPSVTIPAGGSDILKVTLTSFNGFSGSLSIAYTVSPQGITATPTSASVTLSAGGTASSDVTISTSPSTPLKDFNITVRGTSGPLTHSASIIVTIVEPTFSLSTNPTVLALQPGSTAFSEVNVTSRYGFSGTVTLSDAVYGSNLTASLSRTSVTLGASASSTLRVNSTTSAPPGRYIVAITGTSGSLSEQASITVIVIGPGFDISASPMDLLIPAGTSAYSNITLSSLNGFSDTVALNAVPSTSGWTATVTPSIHVLASGVSKQSRLDMSVPPGFPSGSYVVYIEGAATSAINLTIVYVNVPGPLFNLTTTPHSLAFSAGSSGTSNITVVSLYGFSGSVGLSLNCAPGVSATLTPDSANLTPGESFTSTLSVSVSVYQHPGFYFVAVEGDSGSLSSTAILALNVTAPGPIFAISTSGTVSFVSGSMSSFTVTLISLYGFTGTVALATIVSPSTGLDVSCTMPAALTAGSTSTSTCTLNSSTAGGYAVTITGTAFSKTNSATIQVTVTVPSMTPDFSISASPDSVSIEQGSSGTTSITLTALNGFAGTVSLSTAVHPSGPGATLTPASVILGSYGGQAQTITLKINADTGTPLSTSAGTYTMTVTGTSGSKFHTANVTLTVINPSNPTPQGASEILGFDPTVFYGLIGIIVAAAASGIGVVVWKRRASPSRT